MRVLLLALVLAASPSAFAAHPSKTDLRLELPAGSSKKLGRDLARQIAVMGQAPGLRNPGSVAQEMVRGAFASGRLVGVKQAPVALGRVAEIFRLDESGMTETIVHVNADTLHGPSGHAQVSVVARTTGVTDGRSSTTRLSVEPRAGFSTRRGRVVANEGPIASQLVTVAAPEGGHPSVTTVADIAPSPRSRLVLTTTVVQSAEGTLVHGADQPLPAAATRR